MACRREGIAVAFTTSDLIEALTIADRIVVMASGRVTADVSADDADRTMLVQASSGISHHHTRPRAAQMAT